MASITTATRTIWAAAGEINASLGTLDPEDRWEIHEAVTMREGDFVCDPRAVELLAENAPDRVLEPAETALRSAPMREEPRGAHHREDFPETRDEWKKNILCAKGEDGAMRLWTAPTGEVSEEIHDTLKEEHVPSSHHLK